MYDFNQLRRSVKEICKKCVTFKRASFLQKIIDKERWTGQEILKMIKGELTWVPDSDMPRNFTSDALTFGLIVNKKMVVILNILDIWTIVAKIKIIV